MDPSAPNNNNPQGPKPPSSILPGQFVVTQEENTPNQKPQEQNQPAPPPTPMQPPHPLASAPLAGPAPQQSSLSNENTLPPLPNQPTTQAPGPGPVFENQPSPTPYVPPEGSATPPSSESSIVGKLRPLLLILGVLLLLGLIAAALWYFVLNKSQKQESQTTQEDVQIEAPPSPKIRTTGGFSDLPPATEEAQQAEPESEEATPSGQ